MYRSELRLGFDLHANYSSMTFLMIQKLDIDECAEQLDDCDQNCHNYNGSYSCSCNLGFRLNEDELHCDGNVYRKRGYLLYNY